jgi:hypothetical protein
MSETRSDQISESTVARIAGNIAAGLVGLDAYDGFPAHMAKTSVAIAREIVRHVEASKPPAEKG